MSQGMSPYQPPQAQMESQMESDTVPPANISAVPKVIGILHLVFGGIGLVMGVIGIASAAFKEKLEEMQFASYPEEVREGMRGAMQPIYETQKWDMISGVGSLILAVLLIVAGLKLVKYRRQGRKISNIYSALSIGHKLFTIGIVIFIKSPVMKKVGESLEKMSGQSDMNMGTMMGPIVIISGIVMAIVMMVYPILSFFLLSKKQARDSLR
ncbi:MAG: hypothetical protein QNL01_00275 [Akkermansiaceae bacterium]|jgi:Ca2+/Na+ antiporter|tara:strand:+ start:8345 stop:8977 length:633 start_codon:yes stop_codon:yes gene_type:complete